VSTRLPRLVHREHTLEVVAGLQHRRRPHARRQDHGDSIPVRFRRRRCDRPGDDDEPRLIREGRVEPKLARTTRHDDAQVDLDLARRRRSSGPRYRPSDHVDSGFDLGTQRQLELETFGRTRQPIEVPSQKVRHATEGAGDLVHRVTIEKAAIEDRDLRLAPGHGNAVQPHPGLALEARCRLHQSNRYLLWKPLSNRRVVRAYLILLTQPRVDESFGKRLY